MNTVIQANGENKTRPRTLAEAFGYKPNDFKEFNERRSAALLEVEKREQVRIKQSLEARLAWQA